MNYIDFNGKLPIAIEVVNTLISGALDLYQYALKLSLKTLQQAPKMTMDLAKKIARSKGHIKSARAILRSQHATIKATQDLLGILDKVSKLLLVADMAWCLGENLLSGEESWLSDTFVDAGIAGAIYGLSFLPGGFFISLAVTVVTFIFDDKIEAFKDWFYDGWREFWSFSWL